MASSSRTKVNPLHVQVANHLRNKVFSQAAHNAGGRLPSAKALSEQLGVSTITVRQAIKSLAAEGVIVSRAGSGTYVSQEVRDGARTIAVVFGYRDNRHIRSPWHIRINQSISNKIEQRGWSVRHYTLFHGTDVLDERAMDQLVADTRSHKFSGLFSEPETGYLGKDFRHILVDHSIPWLDADQYSDSNAISQDYRMLGWMGAEHLHREGARRIGIIGNARDSAARSTIQPDEYTGFRWACSQLAGIEVRDEWCLMVEPGVGSGVDAFEQIWLQNERPDGLLVADDITFQGVVMAMLKHNVRYPEDIQLVVQGTLEDEEQLPISPLRICFSAEDYSRLVVDKLLGMIQDKVTVVPSVRMAPAAGDPCVTMREMKSCPAVTEASSRT